MKRPEHIARIFDENRKAVLRLVGLWLVIAGWFASRPGRTLPRRLSVFVDERLCKAELCAFYLHVAARRADIKHAPTLESLAHQGPLTIGGIIARLKAVITAVRSLRLPKQRTGPQAVSVSLSFDKIFSVLEKSGAQSHPLLPP